MIIICINVFKKLPSMQCKVQVSRAKSSARLRVVVIPGRSRVGEEEETARKVRRYWSTLFFCVIFMLWVFYWRSVVIAHQFSSSNVASQYPSSISHLSHLYLSHLYHHAMPSQESHHHTKI